MHKQLYGLFVVCHTLIQFDNPGMLHLQYTGGFHAGAWAPLVGDGDDIITELT